MEVYKSINEQLLSQTKHSILLDKIEFKLNENENNLNDNKSLKLQYNYLKPDKNLDTRQNGLISSPIKINGVNKLNKNDGIPLPKHIICSPNTIQLEWKFNKSIGAGYINLGNTCFMNSVLQALTYCPPLVNYLLNSNANHSNNCRVLGLCMTCELIKHIKNSYSNSGSVIRPQNIFQRLKSLAKHFQPGRQEDSHEFLRYVIDNIWKSCIINWESKYNIKLDNSSKETTFINQIFGGYHRSQVTCLSCKAKSDTYDYFMEFILDIKNVSSLEKALENFVQPEILRNENAYKCSHCNKKVPAEKRFTVHRTPNVATFQLKRFDYNRIFGGKITKQISYPEVLNLRSYMSENKGEPINYRLFAVLVHLGATSNSGHYFCYVRNSNKNWYLMDDSRVAATSLNQVLDQQAYMLFYVRIPPKDIINHSDSLLKNSFDKQSNGKLAITDNKPNGLINKDKINLSELTKKINNNLPKLIVENGINNKKTNGESKAILSNGNKSDLLNSNDKLNNNLNKSSNNNLNKLNDMKSSVKRLVPYDNNSSDDDSEDSNKHKKIKLDNNSMKINGSIKKTESNNNNEYSSSDSDDDDKCQNKSIVASVTKHLENHIQSNNEKDKKQILNGFAKFAESIGSLFNDKEDELLKQIETMSKDKIEFPNEKKSTKLNNNKTPTKVNNQNNNQQKLINNQDSQTKSTKTPSKNDDKKESNQQLSANKINQLQQSNNNRTISPVKINGYLSNSYYQTKAATNHNFTNHLNNQWINNSSKCKTSSITSGSSTNTINSTTEWQVIDQHENSNDLKKHLHKSKFDNSWKIADRKSYSSESDNELDNAKTKISLFKQKENNLKTNNNYYSDDEHNLSRDQFKKEEEELDYVEKRFMKKLKKLERKDKEKYLKLNSDREALSKLYLKVKNRYKRKKELSLNNNDNHTIKHKKNKKKHKKERFRNESFHSESDNEQFNNHFNSNQSNHNSVINKNNGNHNSIDNVITPQKNGNLNQFKQLLSGNNKKNDIKSELNEMHLSLLGKNVNTWDGKKTQIDKEVKEDLERSKKKSKDDLYNEEYDRGKIKKVKSKSDDDKCMKDRMKLNPFQKYYEEQIVNSDKNKFIKSL